MIKEELKGFNINIDDIKPNEITHGAMQELIKKIIIEKDVKKFEIVLNENILNIKDRLTDIHSYMGLKLSLKPLEKDISFIIRPTNKLTYDELQQENKQLKEQLQNISNEFLKYNWKEATQEQIYNQLKKLYESIFKGSDSNE